MCVCVCAYVYLYIYIYMCVCVCVCAYIYIYVLFGPIKPELCRIINLFPSCYVFLKNQKL